MRTALDILRAKLPTEEGREMAQGPYSQITWEEVRTVIAHIEGLEARAERAEARIAQAAAALEGEG